MLKIGIFTDTYFPQVNGVATSTATLKKNLEKLGHDVYIFTVTDPRIKEEQDNIYRVPSIPFVSEHRIATFYTVRLAAKIKALNLDIIHTHTEFSLGIFGGIMAKRLKVPLIHTYHTIYEDYTHYLIKFNRLDALGKAIARQISRRSCNAADMVVVPTNKVQHLLRSYGITKEMFSIPTGIDLQKFSTKNTDLDQIKAKRRQLGIRENEKVILYLGRVSKEKNIEELLVHLQDYIKEKQDIKFILVGDGPEKSNLEFFTQQAEIESYVKFVGEVTWESVMAYYQIGDIFVSASQSETQGITYIEALASGLPVVAKADPCLEGVVENGFNGYTFEDKQTFLKALDAVLYDEQHQKELAKHATLSAQNFSEQNFAKKIESVYYHALKYTNKERRLN